MLAGVDAVDADIAALDTQIEQHLAPFGDAVARLDDRHVSTTAKKRSHIRGLEGLGYHVTLEPAA